MKPLSKSNRGTMKLVPRPKDWFFRIATRKDRKVRTPGRVGGKSVNEGKPYRFFGPIEGPVAETLVELILDSRSTQDTLFRFLKGDIGPRELCYELQVIAENEEKRLLEAEDYWEGA